MSKIIPATSMPTTPLRGMAHLHQHTQYSMLDGAAKPKELLKWVKEITPEGTTPTCAITDHGNMYGAVHFHNYAIELGVKPILGCEFYMVSGDHRQPGQEIYHITLLAQNFKGYQNLCRLNAIAYIEGFHSKPRISPELMEQHAEGVICLSGCIGAEIPQLIIKGAMKEARSRYEWYAATYPGRFFSEIQKHTLKCDANAPEHSEEELGYLQEQVSSVLKEWSRELGIGMVATNDGHYVRQNDAESHEVLLAIQTRGKLSDEKRFKFPCDEFYVKTPEELQRMLPTSEWGDEIYDNSLLIAEMCEDSYLPVGNKRVYQLPEVTQPASNSKVRTPTTEEQLCMDTFQGIERRYQELNGETPWGKAAWMEAARHAWKAIGPEGQAECRRDDTLPGKNPDIGQLQRFLAHAICIKVREARDRKLRIPEHALVNQEAEEDEQPYSPAGLLRRIEYELGVICKMDFAGYFLIVTEYTSWARKNGIAVGPGRGSGAGSMVAYALEITDLDPLKYNLLFERFLNPDRISMPDFDIDFDDIRRHEVAQHLRDHYGAERVGLIATFQSLKPRVALKDVARTMDIDFGLMNKLTSLIPEHQGKVTPLEKALVEVPELKQAINEEPRLQKVFEIAQKLENLSKAPSTHAAGVVIGRGPLTDLVPLTRDKNTGMNVVQYDMKAIEDIGLVKMDLLGLRTLSLISKALELINTKRASEGLEPLDARKLPEGVQAAFELIGRGETAGVFQLEGSGITSAARMMKPRGIEDVIALGALYRPGPMENIPTYVRRLHGEEEIDYTPFPTLEAKLRPILDVTQGIPVYQEQIMQMASDIAGYTLGEADLLRRAMGKKSAEGMEEQRQIFLSKTDELGIDHNEAERLFKLMERFADYGFNRSHSAAYGLLSYHTAYLKASYPTEFMAALLTVEQNNIDKVSQYVSEARRIGIKVLPPDINRSGVDFTPTPEGEILFGLSAIRGVSQELTREIALVRDEGGTRIDGTTRPAGPFRDLHDLIRAMPAMGRKSNVLTSLANAGALDSLGERDILIANIESVLEAVRKDAKRSGGAQPLFGDEETGSALQVPVTRMGRREMLELEFLAMGLYISGHPLDEAPEIHNMRSCNLGDIEGYLDANLEALKENPKQRGKPRVKGIVAGVITEIKQFTTKAGKPMGKATISDGKDVAHVVLFNEAWERERDKLVQGQPIAFVANMEIYNGELTVSCESAITHSYAQEMKYPKRAIIHGNITGNQTAKETREMVMQLEDAVRNSPGEMEAEIKLLNNDTYSTMRIKSKVGEQILEHAPQVSWVERVEIKPDDEWIISHMANKKPRRQQHWQKG